VKAIGERSAVAPASKLTQLPTASERPSLAAAREALS
jgi:hypothetical protein